MIVQYTIHTPSLNDAKEQAIRRGRAEGYSHVSVTSIVAISHQEYLITLVVTK